MHTLSRTDARRIAVRAQLLGASRPGSLLEVVRGLTLLQIDATNTVAPNPDLVAWSRLGSAYSREELEIALDQRILLELGGVIRPAEDIALYRADMAAWPGAGELTPWQQLKAQWLATNDGCRRDILARIEDAGPVLAAELPDTCVRPWKSTGWNNNRNVGQLLDIMEECGDVAVAGRRKGQRLWDLASRVYPDDPVVPAAEARRTPRRAAAARPRSRPVPRARVPDRAR